MNKFITFEGCEASGKTTQAKLLYQALNNVTKKVALTREPGGTPESEKLRELLKDNKLAWHYKTEILLHMAARNEHLQQYILPKLKDDFFVICDRYLDSNIAYQAYGMGAKITNIEDIYEIIAGDFMPSLTFILDIDPAESSTRINLRQKPKDRYELMNREFHKNVREGFLEIAQNNQKRFILINGSSPIEEIHKEIILHIKELYEISELEEIMYS